MRKCILKFKIAFCISSMLLLFSTASFAQDGQYNTVNWKFSNPKQMGITVLDVDYFDDNNVIAVGAYGGIAKSTDGGRNWTYGPFTFVNAAGVRTASTFYDVHYITANIAYAVGDRGCMAKTTDGGATWNFVMTPLYANSKNINTCWFLNENKGYIGGEYNSLDSIPKVYVTNDGGATWDSLAAPIINGTSRAGYINNPNISSVLVNVEQKGKQIYRIQFINDNVGYVIGSANGLYPRVSQSANSSTCLPNPTGNLTSSAGTSALLWKITGNTITDYSLSKERLGYTGINTNTVTCTTQYNSAGVTPAGQSYKAMSILDDSTVVMMSLNNNCVVRVHTGVNDSTENVNNPGNFEKGKYQILNFPYPPTGGPNAGPPIPPTQVLLASNPYHIKKAASSKLYASANFGRVWTSIDNGENWIQERSYPEGENYSDFAAWAMDIAPGGKFLFMGQNGAVADSIPGGALFSNYNLVAPGGAYSKFEFADCNTGIGAGGGAITRTLDGGKTWLDNNRPDFTNGVNITGLSYPTVSKAWFSISNGFLYKSENANASQTDFVIDPMYNDVSFQMNDVVALGNDTVYAVGYSTYTVPTANRKTTLFKSTDNGATFNAIDIVATTTTPAFTAPNLSQLAFPSINVGYAAGTRNGIYKTSDAGLTWTSINPFPALNENPTGFNNRFVTYTDIMAVDENTVFAVGNMFTDQNNRRVYKTTDGGATWTDISGNIDQLVAGNITTVLFHDANNGYIAIGNSICKTTDGGATWTLDISPTGIISQTMAFAPRTVPAGINMENRKMFFAGFSGPGGSSNNIMEYGNPANISVNSTETVVNTNCSNANAGSITLNATGAIAPYTYSIDGTNFQTSNVFNGLAAGNYTVVIKDAYCGSLSKNVTVGFTDNLTLTTNLTDTTVCSGAPVQLIASGNAASYTWSPTSGLSNSTIANPVATANGNTSYLVTATLGTCTKTSSINITIKQSPTVSAGPDKTIIQGDAVMLDGSGPANTTSISWTPATGLTNLNTYNPTAKPPVTTTYTLQVINDEGCTSTDDMIVHVIPFCINPKNAFTPNGDGINDKWMVTTGDACTSQIMVKVFNRYGSEVYANNNYQNNWDGTYKGKPVPDGTYYYVISYRLTNGDVVPAKGDVTILR